MQQFNDTMLCDYVAQNTGPSNILRSILPDLYILWMAIYMFNKYPLLIFYTLMNTGNVFSYDLIEHWAASISLCFSLFLRKEERRHMSKANCWRGRGFHLPFPRVSVLIPRKANFYYISVLSQITLSRFLLIGMTEMIGQSWGQSLNHFYWLARPVFKAEYQCSWLSCSLIHFWAQAQQILLPVGVTSTCGQGLGPRF